MWKEVFLLSSMLGYCLGATLEPCPEGSLCHSATEELRATSFEFLGKMSQKDFRSIGSLTLSNASVNKVDPKLKYLKNLEYLDLSYNSVQVSSIPALNSLKTLILKANDLKDISISHLPQNLEHLDLSHNLLSDITREWRLLKNLKTLDLFKNPINCDCNNVLNLELLIKSGIVMPRPLTCHSPSKYAGKDVTSVTCTQADIMQYDEPLEGSGAHDIFDDSFTEKNQNAPFLNEEEDEDEDNNTLNTIIDDKYDLSVTKSTLEPLETIEEEGSGDEDEGSGFVHISDSGVLGCIENCSTPKPLVGDANASPPPGLFDQFKLIFDDVNIFKENDPSTTTTIATTTTVTTTTVAPEMLPVKEPKVYKENNSPNENTHENISSLDENDNANVTATSELERASVVPKNTTAVYAIVGVGLCIAVLFIIAFVKKRKTKRIKNNRRENPASLGEEMKPLSKPPLSVVNDKPVRNSSNFPEHIPLINGQNGKSRDDTPKLTSFTPLAHPELPDRDQEDERPFQNGTIKEPENEVEIRSKPPPELLTPQGTRVTIRESEIPESIPRTPLLVHRQKNSDGEIVTTLVS